MKMLKINNEDINNEEIDAQPTAKSKPIKSVNQGLQIVGKY